MPESEGKRVKFNNAVVGFFKNFFEGSDEGFELKIYDNDLLNTPSLVQEFASRTSAGCGDFCILYSHCNIKTENAKVARDRQLPDKRRNILGYLRIKIWTPCSAKTKTVFGAANSIISDGSIFFDDPVSEGKLVPSQESVGSRILFGRKELKF